MRALALIGILLLAGCLSDPPATPTLPPTPGGTPTPTVTPPPAAVAQDCREGAGEVFLNAIRGGGFVPQNSIPHIVEITHAGELRAFQSHTRGGSGRIVEEPEGAAKGLEHETIRSMLTRANITLDGRDLIVTNGTHRTLTDAEYETFCTHVAKAFPTLMENYPNTNCVDQGSTTWRISMALGEKTMFVDDCAEHAEQPRALIQELRSLEEKN